MRKNKSIRVEGCANKLCDDMNNPEARNFYLKAFWHLSEDLVWNSRDRAKKLGNDPKKLLTCILKNELQRVGK